jgi:hypothetical protein
MTPEQLQALILKQRSTWLELERAGEGRPAKRVLVQRPAELQVRDEFMKFDGQGNLLAVNVELPHVKRYVTGWEGFTESDLVGSAGSSDPVPFSPEVWAVVIEDRANWHQAIAQQLVQMIAAHFAKVAEQAKN